MPQSSSAFAPFRIRIFRILWLATLFSNLGTLVQAVGFFVSAIAPVNAENAIATGIPILPAGTVCFQRFSSTADGIASAAT